MGQVLCISPQVDLALLEVPAEAFWEAPPVPGRSLGDVLCLQDGQQMPEMHTGRTEDDSETSSDSETCDSKTTATECSDSETHPIQKLADSETTGCPDSETPGIQKLADSDPF